MQDSFLWNSSLIFSSWGQRSWTKSSRIGCACLKKPILDYLNQAQTHGESSISKEPSSNPLSADSTYYTQEFKPESIAIPQPQGRWDTVLLKDGTWHTDNKLQCEHFCWGYWVGVWCQNYLVYCSIYLNRNDEIGIVHRLLGWQETWF